MIEVSRLMPVRLPVIGLFAKRASKMNGMFVFGDETVPDWNPTCDSEMPTKKSDASPSAPFQVPPKTSLSVIAKD
jgi:hypothetical protein